MLLPQPEVSFAVATVMDAESSCSRLRISPPNTAAQTSFKLSRALSRPMLCIGDDQRCCEKTRFSEGYGL
jgi:hypothetical protein